MMGKKTDETILPKGPAFPELLCYLWVWFAEILSGCSGGFGTRSIGWRDLEAWSTLTGNRLERWEVDALMRLSAAYVRITTPKKKGE